MAVYIKRTTKLCGYEPFTVVVNDYSTMEVAERALQVLNSLKPQSGIEWQKFYIDTKFEN